MILHIYSDCKFVQVVWAVVIDKVFGFCFYCSNGILCLVVVRVLAVFLELLSDIFSYSR